MNRIRATIVTLLLITAGLVVVVPWVAADHDGDPIPDDQEALLCHPLLKLVYDQLSSGFGVDNVDCDGDDFVVTTPTPDGLPSDGDGDQVPDQVESQMCNGACSRP